MVARQAVAPAAFERAVGRRAGKVLGKGKGMLARLDGFNSARRSKRNVAHHYDLDDRLYDLFLDADRQ